MNIDTLRAKYPNIEFFIGQKRTGGIDGVIYLVYKDIAIFNPMDSDCGRFQVDHHYGLTLDDAKALEAFNQHIVDVHFQRS